MALSRPLLWVRQSICFAPAAVPAASRLQQLRNCSLKQNVQFSIPLSRGSYGGRRIGPNRFRHLQFVAIHGDQAPLEGNLNGEAVVDEIVTPDERPKTPQRRRRRRKAAEESNSSGAIFGDGGKEENLAEEFQGIGSNGSNVSAEHGNGVEEKALDLDAHKDEGVVVSDPASAREEVRSKPAELESKASEEPSRRRRRSRSRKKGNPSALQQEAAVAADKSLSNSETVSDSSAIIATVNENGSDAMLAPETPATRDTLEEESPALGSSFEDSDSLWESSALQTTLGSQPAGESSSTIGDANVEIKKKRPKKKKAEQDASGISGNDVIDSPGRPNTNLVSETAEPAADGAPSDHQSRNDLPSPKARRRRGRRKKSTTAEGNGVTALEPNTVNGHSRSRTKVDQGMPGSHHDIENDVAGAYPSPNGAGLEARNILDESRLEDGSGPWENNFQTNSEGSVSVGDGVAPFGDEAGQGANAELGAQDGIGNLSSLQLEDDLNVSNLDTKLQGSVNGATSVGAEKHEVEESPDIGEGKGIHIVDSSHPAADDGHLLVDDVKPAKRSRRRRRSKKRVPESVHVEPTSEHAEPSAKDPLSSVIWCNVNMKVQATLEQNEFLFVAGANPEFGRWDLSMALELTGSEEEGYLENTVKIPRGTMLEYKYFLEIRDADSTVIDRLFGPEIQYLLPWKDGEDADVEQIRDVWVPDVPKNLPLLSWGDRWWEEMDSSEKVDEARDSTKEDIDEEDYQDARTGESVILDEVEPLVALEDRKAGADSEDWWLKRKIRRKVFPREEPWLLESMLLEQRKTSLRKRAEEAEAEEEATAGRTRAATDGEHKEPTVHVEILINSPQCTMQRVAILEDKKLVELLVEPVTARVQVGNIYLGVVKQLLPGMNGVFVDIGSFQLSLLDITRNQYPYTFPSIAPSSRDPGDTQAWQLFDDDEEENSDWDDAESEEEELEGEDDDEDDEEDEDEEDDEGGVLVVENESFNHERSRTDEEGGSGDKINSTSTSGQDDSVQITAHPAAKTVNFGRKLTKWRKVQEGMQIIVQVKKEALGKKGPRLTAFPSLAGRFWVLIPGSKAVGVSRRITGPERKRLRKLAKELQPENFAVTVRTEALGHDREELEKDLARLIETWKEVLECASAAAVAGDHGMEGAVPVLLHRAMGQTLTLVRDFFTDRVQKMVIDSPQCYQEVISYLQEVAPQLSDRVELYTDQPPIFDTFHIESEIDKFSNKRVSLPNGGYLVIEETEALVSIDVNGGSGVLSKDVFQEEANLAVNLAAAKQIARELRLRDIGGIIVVDFIDMEDQKSQELVVEEMRRATSRDRSSLSFSEISEFGLMQITRRRVRPSVTLMISDPCSHCGGVGRVEAHEATLSKIERALLRLLATRPGLADPLENSKWPQITLRVDSAMGEYLKGRKRKRLTQLSAALKVWLHLKVALELAVGHFQLLEQQHRPPIDKRLNGSGSTKSNQQSTTNSGLLGKRGVLPAKRRRNFFNQASSR